MALTLEQIDKINQRNEGQDTKGDEIEMLSKEDEKILTEVWAELAQKETARQIQLQTA